MEGRELMDAFYSLVDSNNTLKERAKLVRNNGLVWSSAADATVIGTIFAVLYIAVGFWMDFKPFLGWAFTFGVVALVAGVFLHPRAEQKHVQLGNAQLSFISQHLNDEATEMVNKL